MTKQRKMQILRHTPQCGISFATQLHPQTITANTRLRLTPTWRLLLYDSGLPFLSSSVKLCSAQMAELLCRTAAHYELNCYRALWSLCVQPSGYYIYSPVVTICKPSGQCMYSPVVTIRTAQWSLCVQPIGHYVYSPVVTIYTAQWSPYVGSVVSVCTAQ